MRESPKLDSLTHGLSRTQTLLHTSVREADLCKRGQFSSNLIGLESQIGLSRTDRPLSEV